MRLFNLFFIAVLSGILFIGCKKSSTQQTLFTGDAIALGSGSMHSWIKTDNSGKPVSIGLTINAAAISSLPASDTMFMIMFPSMSKSGMSMMMPTPFDHIEMDWAPNGDSGSTVFNHAHLDCHFFTISSTTQMGIMMGMDSIMIPANYMPQNCISDSIDEANMGMHVYDTLSSEYHGTPFDHTFNYGFYQGNMTFIETMCAKSFLDTKASYSGNISQPNAFKVMGYYPLKYSITYDANAKEYTYSLYNLTAH
jgi:hypothetical protein